MIYPANFEQKIGFDRLRAQVAELCSMEAARRRIMEEAFSSSREEIERRQRTANEMRVLLMLDPDAPREEYPDVEHIVSKIGVEGSFLDVSEVVVLRRALTAVGDMVGFILNRPEAQYPCLRARSADVCVFPDIIRRINQIIDDEGRVRDGASPELLSVRRAIRDHEGQVAKRLQQVLANAKRAGIVDADAMLSVRRRSERRVRCCGVVSCRMDTVSVSGVSGRRRRVGANPNTNCDNINTANAGSIYFSFVLPKISI